MAIAHYSMTFCKYLIRFARMQIDASISNGFLKYIFDQIFAFLYKKSGKKTRGKKCNTKEGFFGYNLTKNGHVEK